MSGAVHPQRMPALSVAKNRSWWLHQLRAWHWISSAVCLIGMLLFAFTGITLNHAADIPASSTQTLIERSLPAAQQALLAGIREGKAPLPAALAVWISTELGVQAAGREAEWSEFEVYLALPGPGADAWLSIDRETGLLHYERNHRGWIATLNDLHKGRDTGAAWRGFIDVFSAACIVFCLTGLLLLALHAGTRPLTWPLVGLGLVAPLLLLILFIH